MRDNFISTISSKGQITLPKGVREKLSLKAGQVLLMKIKGNELSLQKVTLSAQEEDFSAEEWESLRKMASKKGKTYSSGKKFLQSLK